MQFLKIGQTDTLKSISKIAGDRNVESILVANSLQRSPSIGQQFTDMCNNVAQTSPDVPLSRKLALLNTFTGQSDLFETVSLFSEASWKVLSNIGCIPGALRIPDSITLPDSYEILGGKGNPVKSTLYSKVINSLQKTGSVDSDIFNEYSVINPASLARTNTSKATSNVFSGFNLPWGKITLYSSLANDSMDFPVYPEELSDGRKATYATMPDMIYQYEPWYVYESSGPRQMEYTFHFHRDMWSGDHRDGMANKLIRFCEACCYPNYTGSVVNTSTAKLYINGACHCSGIVTEVSTKWSGPIGLDGWYLECELTLNMVEVAEQALDFDTVRTMSLIGG